MQYVNAIRIIFPPAMWIAKALILLLFIYSVFSASKKFNLRITKFTNGCPELNPIANFTEVAVNKNTVKFKAFFSEDVIGEQKGEFTIERCLDKDIPSTCEKYHTLKIPFFCQVLGMGAWSSFINGTTPQWKCPFKKGFYVTKKSIVFDIGDISVISIGGNYYWKVAAKVYLQDTKRMVTCFYVEGKTFFD